MTRNATILALLLAGSAFAQLPPMPVAPDVAEPQILTNHVCEARLPVVFLKWKAPVGWLPKAYRIYASTNPLAQVSAYSFYAETPRTNLPVLTLEQSQMFFAVSAVHTDGRESIRVTK